METMGNINLDVIKQGSDIEEMKLIILSQQVQITKLKKMVKKLVQKKKRKQYVLKKRGDAFNKGEKQDEGEKHSPIGMETEFEGELNTEKENTEAESSKAAETVKLAAEKAQAAVTGLSVEEIEIAETLLKAKTDTPKGTQKAKGVEIKEGGLEQKRKEISEAEMKRKGKSRQKWMNLIEELYTKEMSNLKGDSTQREEAERRMKERHDLNIQQPFPESEETTPSKEKAEEKKEEHTDVEVKSDKRVKTIASKKLSKKPKIAEAEKDTEPSVTSQVEQSSQSAQQPSQSNVHFELYMTVTDSDPVKAYPISVQAPEIIHWDILEDQGKEYFRIKRMGDHFEVYSTWGIVRCCSRSDLEEMFKVGINLYEDVLKTLGMNIKKLAIEYLCMMFSPDRVKHVIKDVLKSVDNWMLIERCGVYILTIDKSFHEYYLVDKIYDHSLSKLHGMLKAKLIYGVFMHDV
ncbi:hypothetical protein L6452_32466 [Arctium lappa]|uniref:Uncharacterized protein n=1 Tax=Arctium lappa TaxID=4217 RepID=A0ACB8Z4K2_ARCLA|nr:hypothetical protein L6452_32466 [Arctium lappa]